MDQLSENHWFQYIDGLTFSPSKKKVIKDYVHTILDNDGVVIIDVHHLAALIGIEDEVLDRMIVHPERYYRSFTIPKRAGGERLILAPYPALMKVQRWIYRELLLPSISFLPSVTGFLPSKSVLDNAIPHIGHPYVLKVDIQDFFPSISINRVIAVFKRLGYHHRLSYALAALCCYKGGLPQGAPTSPILSNIIAKKLDKRIQGFSESLGLTYTRYADDITLSGNMISMSYVRFVERIIIEEGFTPKVEKTHLLGPAVKKIITGVSISSGKPTIPKNMKRYLRQKTYYINKYGLRNHLKHEHISDSIYPIRLQGTMAYWKMIEKDSLSVLERFKSLQEEIRHPRRKWRFRRISPKTSFNSD